MERRKISRSTHRPAAALVLLGTVLLLSCSRPAETAPTGEVPSALPAASRIPHSRLGPLDEIDAVDFAVDRDGSLHLVWRAAVGVLSPAAGTVAYRLLYARGERPGSVDPAWTAPIELEGRLAKPPRLVLHGGVLHIIQEEDLRHFTSMDGGRSWQEQPALRPPGGGIVLGLDVLSHGADLLLAYLIRPAADRLELRVLRRPASGDTSPAITVASFPGSIFTQPAPRLVAHGGQLHLLCGLNVENRRSVQSAGRTAEEVEVTGRLAALRSTDGGATWSPPVGIAAGTEGIKPLAAVELLSAGGRLHAFWSAFGLYTSRLGEDRGWSPATAVAPHRVSVSRGAYESGPVAAAAAPGGAYVAWIDTRFRRSERRWWKPTGGIPWSDDNPAWAENDVLLLPLPEAAAAAGAQPARPERLTPPGSLTRMLRARAGPDRLFLVWAGRPKTGKEITTSGAGPEILFTTVPPHGTRPQPGSARPGDP